MRKATLDMGVWERVRWANSHLRVNIRQSLQGVVFYCIAVYQWSIVYPTPRRRNLIRTTREINHGERHLINDKVRSEIGADLVARRRSAAGVTLGIYGLTFKPVIDDLRESGMPAIARALATTHLGRMRAVELLIAEMDQLFDNGIMLTDRDNGLHQADICVALVSSTSFKSATSFKAATSLTNVIMDTRWIGHR